MITYLYFFAMAVATLLVESVANAGLELLKPWEVGGSAKPQSSVYSIEGIADLRSNLRSGVGVHPGQC